MMINMQSSDFASARLQRILLSAYSDRQQIILLIIQICSGLFSVIGSSIILYLIWRSPDSAHYMRRRGRLQRGNASKITFERIMIGLSISDLIHSIRCIIAPIAVPQGVTGAQIAIGNQATCIAQGFLFQLFTFAILYYSTSLAIYFALSINPKVSNNTIKYRCEPFLHGIPILLAVVPAFVGLLLGMYNPTAYEQQCHLGVYPLGCDEGGDYSTCTRGKNSRLLLLVCIGICWVCFLIIICCMMYIIVLTWSQQRKMESRYGPTCTPTDSSRNSTQRNPSSSKQNLKRIATQAILYILVVFLTWSWSFVTAIVFRRADNIKYAFLVLEKLFFPLQGLLNLFIYIRPRFVDIRRKNPTTSRWKAITIILSGNVNRQENSLSNFFHLDVPDLPSSNLNQIEIVSNECLHTVNESSISLSNCQPETAFPKQNSSSADVVVSESLAIGEITTNPS
jgi:hypothetical protein